MGGRSSSGGVFDPAPGKKPGSEHPSVKIALQQPDPRTPFLRAISVPNREFALCWEILKKLLPHTHRATKIRSSVPRDLRFSEEMHLEPSVLSIDHARAVSYNR